MSENTILSNIEYDAEAGSLSYKGSRYLLIRPETILGFQDEMEQLIGDKTREVFYQGGFQGGYISSKRYKAAFNFTDRQIIDFMIKMGAEIGWGDFSLKQLDVENRRLQIRVARSPFNHPGKSTPTHADYMIMGVIGGMASVIFNRHCRITFVDVWAESPDSKIFTVDMGETPSILLKGKKILVVDDEEDVVDSIEDALDSCVIDKARDFETAARLLQIKTYDAAILDLNGVNGYELLDIALSRKTPAVILTAHALDANHFARTMEKGAHAYLPKEKLADIQLFLADILSGTGHRPERNRIWFKRLENYYNKKFGHGWKDSIDPTFWKKHFIN